MLSELAGIKLQHVPYASQPQAVTDIMSGRISLWITTLGGQIGNIRSGKVRALAVSGAARSELFPDVPTFKEQGIGFVDETSWYGFFAPKGTPKEVVAKVNRDVNRILDEPEMKQRTATMGFRIVRRPARQARRDAQERDRQMGRHRQERRHDGEVTGGRGTLTVPASVTRFRALSIET